MEKELTELEKAKQLVAEQEKKEVEGIAKEYQDLIESIKQRGYTVDFIGNFFNNQLEIQASIRKL
jgi:hypothetical protein